MTDHELQSWLKHIADAEIQFWNYLDYLDATASLDDTFGWGARLRNMWEKEPHHPCGLLLTGPDGCGKHTAAVHMFRILSDDYYIALISGPALCDGGFDNAKARLLGTIGSYGKENKPLCLILDGLEDCTFRKELFTVLGEALTTAWLSCPALPPVFVILIDASEEDLPTVLRSRLRLCRMSPPTASQRRAYLGNDAFNMIPLAVNVDLLVSSTEGLTYAQLADLTRNLVSTLCCLPHDQFTFTDRELMDFLKSQLPDSQILCSQELSAAQPAPEISESERLKKQCQDLIQAAEDHRRNNNGVASSEEAAFYIQAHDICRKQIKFTGVEYMSWRELNQKCERQINEIAEALAPQPKSAAPQPRKREIIPAKLYQVIRSVRKR